MLVVVVVAVTNNSMFVANKHGIFQGNGFRNSTNKAHSMAEISRGHFHTLVLPGS